MISVNKSDKTITGFYGKEQYAVPFDEATYSKMMELSAKANTVSTMEELNSIFEEFKTLTEFDETARILTSIPNVFVAPNGRYYMKTGYVVSSVPMPEALVSRFKDSIDKGIDTTPLIKFWTRFLRNPKLRELDENERLSFSERVFNYINMTFTNSEMVDKLVSEKGFSEELAEELATVPQVQVTLEGLLKTYKVSKEIDWKYVLDENGNSKKVDRFEKTKEIDEVTGLVTYKDPENILNEQRVFEPAVMHQGGDAFYCGEKLGHVIKVGQVHYLPDWSFVNTNDNVSCVKGLHVGGLYYIQGYQHVGTETHNVLIDPMHIGAVPDDNTGAIRVLQYYVLDAFSGVNGSIYHSSGYGSLTDTQWEKMRKESIDEYGKLLQEKAESLNRDIEEISNI